MDLIMENIRALLSEATNIMSRKEALAEIGIGSGGSVDNLLEQYGVKPKIILGKYKYYHTTDIYRTARRYKSIKSLHLSIELYNRVWQINNSMEGMRKILEEQIQSVKHNKSELLIIMNEIDKSGNQIKTVLNDLGRVGSLINEITFLNQVIY